MTVCLHTHRPTTGALGEAENVGPRQTGRPEEALPRAFATAPLSEPALASQPPQHSLLFQAEGSSHTQSKRVRQGDKIATRIQTDTMEL